jgi:hypothetical protein
VPLPDQVRQPASDHHVFRESLIHSVAFLLAAAVGAVILWRFYWFFEWNTDDPTTAREAFLASIVVIGGVGPAISLLFLWLWRVIQRRRD